jgi:cytochrome bd-type quinol oxidase subunit 2
MGVLAMVFGGAQVLMTGFGLASQPFSKQMMGGMGKAFSGMPHAEGQPDVAPTFERLGRLTEELKPYTYLTGFAMLAFAIALIIVGWMLYTRRAQARPAAIAWAAAALVYLPVQIWVQVKVILPRTQEITKAMVDGTSGASAGVAESIAAVQGVMTVVFYLAFYTPFPVLLLWLIGRASAKNDLAPAA